MEDIHSGLSSGLVSQCLIIFLKTLNFNHVMLNAYHIKIFCLKLSFSLKFTAIVQYINKL